MDETVVLVVGRGGLARDRRGCRGGRGRRGDGRVTEEDICNTNRLLSLPLTIGLEEHQELHVQPDK